MGFYRFLRPLLFRLDAETGHEVGLAALRAAQAVPGWAALGARRNRAADPRLARQMLGTTFPNPIGLAVVELMRIEGKAVIVRGLDCRDRTPLLDIKPYFASTDAVPEARRP